MIVSPSSTLCTHFLTCCVLREPRTPSPFAHHYAALLWANLQILPNCQVCNILLIIFCQECHLLKPWPFFLFIIVSTVSLVVKCVIFWNPACYFLFPYSASGYFPIFKLRNSVLSLFSLFQAFLFHKASLFLVV